MGQHQSNAILRRVRAPIRSRVRDSLPLLLRSLGHYDGRSWRNVDHVRVPGSSQSAARNHVAVVRRRIVGPSGVLGRGPVRRREPDPLGRRWHGQPSPNGPVAASRPVGAIGSAGSRGGFGRPHDFGDELYLIRWPSDVGLFRQIDSVSNESCKRPVVNSDSRMALNRPRRHNDPCGSEMRRPDKEGATTPVRDSAEGWRTFVCGDKTPTGTGQWVFLPTYEGYISSTAASEPRANSQEKLAN